MRAQLRLQKAQHVRLVVRYQHLGQSAVARHFHRLQRFLQRSHRREQLGAAIQIGKPFLGGNRAGRNRFRVVLDAWQPIPTRFAFLRSRGFGLHIRQPHREGGAFALLAFDEGFAALDFGQFLDQRQADADALILPLGRAVRLPEAVEHERQVLFGNAHARVGNAEHKFLALLLRAQRHRSAGGRELKRVEHQVEQQRWQQRQRGRQVGRGTSF